MQPLQVRSVHIQNQQERTHEENTPSTCARADCLYVEQAIQIEWTKKGNNFKCKKPIGNVFCTSSKFREPAPATQHVVDIPNMKSISRVEKDGNRYTRYKSKRGRHSDCFATYDHDGPWHGVIQDFVTNDSGMAMVIIAPFQDNESVAPMMEGNTLHLSHIYDAKMQRYVVILMKSNGTNKGELSLKYFSF